jgi:hypothetical protein
MPPSLSIIAQSIDQLEKLSAALAGVIPSNSRSLEALPRRVRMSKETLLTISVLLPKLEAMRADEEMPKPGRMCPGCEDE